MTADARTRRVIAFYEALSPADLDRLAEIYADDVRFKDPFNDVQGVAALRAVFAHMFATLHAPRFEVSEALTEGDRAFLTWRFVCARRADAEPLSIHGGTLLRFAADGRVSLHRDYWDAAEELYEKLPLLGSLMRWLKARLRTPA